MQSDRIEKNTEKFSEGPDIEQARKGCSVQYHLLSWWYTPCPEHVELHGPNRGFSSRAGLAVQYHLLSMICYTPCRLGRQTIRQTNKQTESRTERKKNTEKGSKVQYHLLSRWHTLCSDCAENRRTDRQINIQKEGRRTEKKAALYSTTCSPDAILLARNMLSFTDQNRGFSSRAATLRHPSGHSAQIEK